MADQVSHLPGDLRVIDDHHLGRTHVIATYALLGDVPAIVDPGPTTTLPNLEAGLNELGMQLGDVQAILLTHIHLDHAAATGTIIQRNPHIKLYVHERGAPHMINPEKLIKSATRLYGDAMDYLWGDFLPVPAENVVALSGGETVALGRRTLAVHYAPGHASHHVIYHDQTNGAAFVGDVAGVRLPGFAYARPATPPPDLDVELWDKTLGMLAEMRPEMLCLTHFGAAHNPQEHIASYRERLLRWTELAREALASEPTEAAQFARLQAQADAELGDLPEDAARYEQATPLFQSWLGFVRYWNKRNQ